MRRTLAFLLAAALSCVAHGAQPAIDGDLSDWPAGVSVSSDADDVRLLIDLPRPMALVHATQTIALRINIDGDNASGQTFDDFAGADISVYFSPPYRGEVGNGASVTVHAEDFNASVRPAAVGLLIAPSYASPRYEIRLSRRAELSVDDIIRFDAPARLRWALTPLDAEGASTAVWSAGDGDIVPGGDDAFANLTLPEAPEGGVRVASMNVLWASPMISPPPFERLMNAIDADIWLFQEWDIRERDQPRLPLDATEEWLETRLKPKADWTVIAGDQRGVLIASRLPLQPTGPVGVKVNTIGDRRAIIERSVRYVSAVAETPAGKLLLACVHLKCCGGVGGEEDRQRIGESVAVSAALHEALDRTGATGVVVGGDFNLVGSPIPLAVIKNGLDPAGGDLAESNARVLGDDAVYTWTQAESRFLSGRLDYMLSSPSSLRAVSAWILDTARLSDEALSAMGLLRDDSSATDHRPIVVDYVSTD